MDFSRDVDIIERNFANFGVRRTAVPLPKAEFYYKYCWNCDLPRICNKFGCCYLCYGKLTAIDPNPRLTNCRWCGTLLEKSLCGLCSDCFLQPPSDHYCNLQCHLCKDVFAAGILAALHDCQPRFHIFIYATLHCHLDHR